MLYDKKTIKRLLKKFKQIIVNTVLDKQFYCFYYFCLLFNKHVMITIKLQNCIIVIINFKNKYFHVTKRLCYIYIHIKH